MEEKGFNMSSEINEVAKVSVSIFFQKSQESIAFFITFFYPILIL